MLNQNEELTRMAILLDEERERNAKLVQENVTLRSLNETQTQISAKWGEISMSQQQQLSDARRTIAAITMGNTNGPRRISDN